MGAIERYPNFNDGDILPVVTAKGEFVGYGYFHKGQSISGRMVSFTDADPTETVASSIMQAITLRRQTVPVETTAYRLINGEGDNVPGLIVDVYGDVAVLQINTLGMEKLKTLIIDTLLKALPLKAVYEKSNTVIRRKEGLPEADGWAFGKAEPEVTVQEYGLQFNVSLRGSQKTGFFLDQREMRQLVKRYAAGKTVLNCFSYTGGFSVYALSGGALRVDSVDISETAVAAARKNVVLNGFSETENGFFAQDVSSFCKSQRRLRFYYFGSACIRQTGQRCQKCQPRLPRHQPDGDADSACWRNAPDEFVLFAHRPAAVPDYCFSGRKRRQAQR